MPHATRPPARSAISLTPIAPTSRALTAAITGYLGVCEQRLGIEAGTIAGEPLREALRDLPRHAIEIAAAEGSPLFEAGDPVDPCVNCARSVEGLVRDGLVPAVVAP